MPSTLGLKPYGGFLLSRYDLTFKCVALLPTASWKVFSSVSLAWGTKLGVTKKSYFTRLFLSEISFGVI